MLPIRLCGHDLSRLVAASASYSGLFCSGPKPVRISRVRGHMALAYTECISFLVRTYNPLRTHPTRTECPTAKERKVTHVSFQGHAQVY